MTLIEAAKLALGHGEFPQGSGIIHELRQAIAKAEQQEPVVCNECKEWEKVCDQHLRHIKKLKAKREWQGLTDEEMKNALVSVDAETKRLPPGFRDFARVIEALLKEKNA